MFNTPYGKTSKSTRLRVVASKRASASLWFYVIGFDSKIKGVNASISALATLKGLRRL